MGPMIPSQRQGAFVAALEQIILAFLAALPYRAHTVDHVPGR